MSENISLTLGTICERKFTTQASKKAFFTSKVVLVFKITDITSAVGNRPKYAITL